MATQKYIGFVEMNKLYYNDLQLGSYESVKEAFEALVRKWKNKTYQPVGVMTEAAATSVGWKPGLSRGAFNVWSEANKHLFITGDEAPGLPAPITPGPRKPKPQVCPEVWFNKPEVDTTDYMAAVRDMCKGGVK